jgi:hypothetical protein
MMRAEWCCLGCLVLAVPLCGEKDGIGAAEVISRPHLSVWAQGWGAFRTPVKSSFFNCLSGA